MSVSNSEQVNQGAKVAENTVKAGSKPAAAATKKAAKTGAKTGKIVWGIMPTKAKIIVAIVLILVIIFSVFQQGVASSSFRRVFRANAVKEENTYNLPKSDDDAEDSLYNQEIAREDTVSLVDVIHEAKNADKANLSKRIEAEVSKRAAQLQKSGTTVDAELSIAQAKWEEAEASGYMYVQEGSGNTVSTSSEINILMVDNSKANERVAARFEKCGCKCTIVFDDASIDADKYDALVIPGGHNVTPSLYGAKKSKYTSGTNLEKDLLQIKAVKAFAEKGKPILGICRGCQLINVAFGGTIDQGNGVYHKGWHKVSFEKGSWVYGIYGKSLNAYHYHKQQIATVAPGFKVTTWGKKGKKKIIEGIEHETLPIYCTQWHPDMKENGDEGQKVFETFVEEVRKRKPAASGNTGTSSGSIDGKHVSSNPAIQRAINWAIQTCNDDSFNYGKSGITNRWGCYYCGTNDVKVKEGGGDTRFLKTYMCMAFVTAAYAHGAGDPAILNACQKRKKGITTESFAANNKRFGGCFKLVGKSKDLKVSDLEAGDIIVWYDASCSHGHLSMYIGDGDIADAGIRGWGKKTIAIRNNRAGSFLRSNKNDYVMRYVGTGGSTEITETTVQSLPTYDSITTLKTISEDTGTKVKVNTGSGYAVQSFAYSDGTYYVQTSIAGAKGSGGHIHRLTSDGTEEAVSEKLSTRHGNGLAYCATDNTLYSVTVSGVGSNKKAVKIDPSSLKVSGTANLKHGTSSIAYDRITNRFVTSSGASSGKAKDTGYLYIYGTNFSSKAGAKDIEKKRWATPGDIAAYNGIVYVTISGGDQVFGSNHIDMYNENTGGYLGSYDCPYGEIEGIDIDDKGQIVLLFHASGGDFLQFTGLTVPGGLGGLGQTGISVLDMDILAAYNISVSNTDMYMNSDGINEKGSESGWLDKLGYRDVSGKRIPIYWFGQNRGMINYEKDLKKKLKTKNKGIGIETEISSSGTSNTGDSTSAAIQGAIDWAVKTVKDEWYLLLVNASNKIPDGYNPELATIDAKYLTKNDEWRKYIDKRVYSSLMKMMDDCIAAGYKPLICSAYRTNEQQQSLYDSTANKNDTALPGTSEHECGLAVDIVDADYQVLDDNQADTKAQKWLMEHCQDYGFILRYPKGKQDSTGIIYEPWHYRYVGKEAAKAIMQSGCTLEEYLSGTVQTVSSASDDDAHFYKIIVGSQPEAVTTTDEDGKSVTKYILPVTVKESDVEELMEPLFGLTPEDYYTNSKTIKTAKSDAANNGEADLKEGEADKLFNISEGTATNLTATYSLSDITGKLLFGDPQVAVKTSGIFGTGSLKLPLAPGSFVVTSHFTYGKTRTDVNTGRSHDGVDLGAPIGTPIYASLPGTVTLAKYNGGYGNCVVVKTLDGSIEIFYGHMSKILCKEGDTVQTGQLIGKVGSTGISTGPHLHFEVRQNGTPIDPEPLLGLSSN